MRQEDACEIEREAYLDEEIRPYQRASVGMFVAGGVVTAAGAALLATSLVLRAREKHDHRAARIQVAPWIGRVSGFQASMRF